MLKVTRANPDKRNNLMKAIPIIALAISICGIASAKDHHYHAPKVSTYHAPKLYAPPPVHVNGYAKRNGTYVMPHVRTAPNPTRIDNWSSRPNVNPYTGKVGTKDPFAPPSSGG